MKKLLLLILAGTIACSLMACRDKGPAQTAGQKLDDGASAVKEAVTPKGPVEKAGKKVDDAISQ